MKWIDGAILPLALLRKKMACFHFFWTHFRLFSHISAKYSTVLVVAQLLFASSLSLKPHSVNFSWQTSSVLFTLCLLNPNCCHVCVCVWIWSICRLAGCTDDIFTSDHSPVFATFEVGVVSPLTARTGPVGPIWNWLSPFPMLTVLSYISVAQMWIEV